MVNPFTPDFGTTPRLVIGRDVMLGRIGRAFGPGFDPHRTTWLRASRGTGKTVILNEVQNLAGQAGRAVVQEDAQSPGGLCQRITRRLIEVWKPPPKRRLRGVNLSTPVGGGGVEFEQSSGELPALRDTIEAVLNARHAPRFPYDGGRPFVHVVRWSAMEPTKNLSEMCVLRRLPNEVTRR